MLPRETLDLLKEKVKLRTKRSIMKSGMLRKASVVKVCLRPFERENEEED